MYSAAVSSSRLPVTTMTGVSGASRSAMRSASAAPNVGKEWSVRMMSGAKVWSASRYAGSESTRRVEEEFQRLRPVAGDEHLMREIAGLEGAQGQLHIARVVLDQQDLDFRRPGHRSLVVVGMDGG